MKILKNLFIFLVLVAVIAGSFWISFLLGKNILSPVKKPPTIELVGSKEPDVLEQLGKVTFEVEALTSSLGLTADAKSKDKDDVAVDYMEPKISSKHPSKKASPAPTEKAQASVSNKNGFEIQNGLFALKSNATSLVQSIRKLGYEVQMLKTPKYYRVFTTASTMSDAKQISKILREKGFEAQITGRK